MNPLTPGNLPPTCSGRCEKCCTENTPSLRYLRARSADRVTAVLEVLLAAARALKDLTEGIPEEILAESDDLTAYVKAVGAYAEFEKERIPVELRVGGSRPD